MHFCLTGCKAKGSRVSILWSEYQLEFSVTIKLILWVTKWVTLGQVVYRLLPSGYTLFRPHGWNLARCRPEISPAVIAFLAQAHVGEECVGAIVCKLDFHKKIVKRGYIAMLAVDSKHRKKKIGSTLVMKAIQAMIAEDADEVTLWSLANDLRP